MLRAVVEGDNQPDRFPSQAICPTTGGCSSSWIGRRQACCGAMGEYRLLFFSERPHAIPIFCAWMVSQIV
jgi:hypothetical protein